MKQTLLSFLLALLPIVAKADVVEIDYITYNLVKKTRTAEVTRNEKFNYRGDITIPNTVVFEGITYDVTSIGEKAFSSSWVDTVIIPNSVISIGEFAFSHCNSLRSITIPNSVTSIGQNVFFDCEFLFEVQLPNSLNSISNGFFTGCKLLSKITIPNSVKTIGISAFKDCGRLSNITIPNSVTKIDISAFENCTKLSSITIPNSVTYIGTSAFEGCTGLTNITIGNGVNRIWKRAFASCPEITDVYCYVKTIGQDKHSNYFYTFVGAFEESHIEYATLHVPESAIEAYKSTTPWNEFKSIEKIVMPEYTLTYLVDGVEYKTCKVEQDGSITPEPTPTQDGYTFSGWSGLPEVMPDHDVTVTGTFTINHYNLTYVIDDTEYKAYNLEYGAIITKEADPEREGYTFSGWSEIPETMPDQDVTITGTFTANKYKLTYIVGGNEFKTYEVEFGAFINPEAFPEQEGYTFSGWSEIPETMPAHDVTVTGSFTVNTYTLTYMVDGEVYKTVDFVYGTTITPEDEPAKANYTFSGWSEIPETMPAHDVIVTGRFERHFDVGNVASVIDFILNENFDEEDLELYDMNSDGELNIGDLILIVRKVLDSASKTMTSRTDVECIMPDLAQYTAAQFVVNVPQNVREQDIRLTRAVAKTHQMMCKQIEPGKYAVVVYSLTNSEFAAEGSGFIEVETEDSQPDGVDVQNVVLAKHTGETAWFGKLAVATAIADVERDETHGTVYDLKGRKQEKASQKGVYIKNGKKIVVK